MKESHPPAPLESVTRTRAKLHILVPQTITRPFRDYLVSRFPVLARRRSYLQLTVYLLRASHRAPDTGVPVPYKLIGAIAGKMPQVKQRNFKSGQWLAAYQEEMQRASDGSFGFTFMPPLYGVRCRMISDLSCDEDLKAAMARDSAEVKECLPDDLVHIGRPSRRQYQRRQVRAAAGQSSGSQEPADCNVDANTPELVITLRDYLHGLPQQVFSRLCRADTMKLVYMYVQANYEAYRGQEVRSAVQAIVCSPKPYYRMVERSCRLYTTRMTLASLPSKLRQTWTGQAGWIELDLKNAELAAVSKLWKIDSLRKALACPTFQFWDELMLHLGTNASLLRREAPDTYQKLKQALKANVYGMCFLMSLRNLLSFGPSLYDANRSRTSRHRDLDRKADLRATTMQEFLEDFFDMPLSEIGRRFMGHPLILDILEARKKRVEQLRSERVLVDCFGRELCLPDLPRNAEHAAIRSLLAQEAQALEMLLLKPCIGEAVEEARKARPLWRISLWQHDGFSICLKEPRHYAATVRILQGGVQAMATALGVPTRLEVVTGPHLQNHAAHSSEPSLRALNPSTVARRAA